MICDMKSGRKFGLVEIGKERVQENKVSGRLLVYRPGMYVVTLTRKEEEREREREADGDGQTACGRELLIVNCKVMKYFFF